jgi:26S proteasome regulatory subunit T2
LNDWFLCCVQADFRKAKEKVLYKKKEGVPEGLYM